MNKKPVMKKPLSRYAYPNPWFDTKPKVATKPDTILKKCDYCGGKNKPERENCIHCGASS